MLFDTEVPGDTNVPVIEGRLAPGILRQKKWLSAANLDGRPVVVRKLVDNPITVDIHI